MNFEKTVKGFFVSIEGDWAIFYILEESSAYESYTFLKSYKPFKNKTIHDGKFKVKITEKSLAFLDKKSFVPVPLSTLENQVIEMNVMVKNYNFFTGGKKISGWTMYLLTARPG